MTKAVAVSKSANSRIKYIPALDGLRGLAILSVLVYHLPTPWLEGGFIGVDIFFVLSGFLITSLLVSEFDRCGSVSLRNFYIRRALRLGPALIVLLMSYCLISFFFCSSQQAERNYIDALIALTYMSNWARAFLIHSPTLLGHTWSLSIEEQFYIIWPVILLLLLRFAKRQQVVVAALALAALSFGLRVYLLAHGASLARLGNGLDTRLDGLMLGSALGVAWVSGMLAPYESKLSRMLVLMTPLALMYLMFLLVTTTTLSPWMYQYGYLMVELLTIILILDVLMSPESWFKAVLETRVLVWFGMISYSLYLWHYPIYRWLPAFNLNTEEVIIIGSLLSLPMAWLSYLVIEQWGQKRKKDFDHTSKSDNPVIKCAKQIS